MRVFARTPISLAWRVASLTLALVSAGCGGDDPTGDAGVTTDGGPPDRRSPQDLDGDEWPNEADNCAMIFNPEQRDRDHDGVGDECDTCPATPNNGASGQPSQAACVPQREAEPNDLEAEAVTAPALGAVSVVQGSIEVPASGNRPVDRFQVMLGARTLVHVRVARAGATSLLEPEIVITGGGFTSPREAQGLFVAERDVYASAAGVYQIEIHDRREDANIGGELFGYELSIVTRDVVTDSLTLPVADRTLRLDPAGTIGFYEIDLVAALRTRVLVETPLTAAHQSGIDPIVVVEGPDGATLGENDDYVADKRDARYFAPFPGGRGRVIVDHARIIGTADLELKLTVDQPPDNFEVEPNDQEMFATPLIFPSQSRGLIDPPVGSRADVDVWSFTAAAGSVASFRGLTDANSQVDPYLSVGQFVNGEFVELYANGDFSGTSARVEAIFPVAGTYHLLVTDQRNVPGMTPRGGPLFPYTVFSERLGIQPQREITASGDVDAVFDQGGRLLRYLVTASVGPSLLELETSGLGMMDDMAPYLRLYRPGVTGIIEEGDAIHVILPVAGTYVLGVHNADEGKGGLGYTFTIDTTLIGLAEVSDTEPNDMVEQPVAALPAALVGRIDLASDVDRYALVLERGDRLRVLNHPVVADLSLALYAPGQSMPAAAGTAAIEAYRVPADGTYVLEVSGGSSADYQVAVRKR